MLAGCGGSAASAAHPQVRRVTISQFAYHPVTVTIHPGDTVIWTNHDPAVHTVTADRAPSGTHLASPDLNRHATYRFTFTVPGTYHYYCLYHTFMHGTIIVRRTHG